MKNVFRFLGIAFVACSMLVACDDTETFTIKVKANDSSMGTVTGGGKYENGATATLEATPNAGYVFVDWEDGSKNNPRLVTVTADAEYTANFAVQTGVKVVFGDLTWNANYINGQTNGQAYLIAAAQTDANSYPFVSFYCGEAPAVGTINGDATINAAEGSASRGNIRLEYYSSSDRGVSIGGNSCGDWWAQDLVVNVTAFDADAMSISLTANANMWDIAGIVYDGVTTNEGLAKKALTMTASAVELAGVKGLVSNNVTGKLARR
ncbi:MAG: hypothetical protein K5842_07925 [Bacteroidales bacterium]|nr:hypothetical protein [Bacteroidales bacterium]